MKEEKKHPEEWEKELKIKVLDPDGWDRANLAKDASDWDRPLTEMEFFVKAAASTCRWEGDPWARYQDLLSKKGEPESTRDDFLMDEDELQEYMDRVDSHGDDAIHMDQAEHTIKVLAEFEAELRREEAHAHQQMEAVRTWINERREAHAKKRKWWDQRLKNFLIQQGRKSMKLINGTVKTMKGREVVDVVDPIAFFDAVKGSASEESFITKTFSESPNKKSLMAYYNKNGKLPPGIQVVRNDPSFSIKFADHLNPEQPEE